MSYSIDLSNLVKEQFKLDSNIQNNHKVSYEDTYQERVLALLVELGEFANTTRCFKFWSNKGMDVKERVLDEAADCLHFYLSIFITNEFVKRNGLDHIENAQLIGEMKEPHKLDNKELTKLFMKAFECASIESLDDVNHYIYNGFGIGEKVNDNSCSFIYFLQIIAGLGFTFKDLEDAYYQKLGVNYNRQKTNY